MVGVVVVTGDGLFATSASGSATTMINAPSTCRAPCHRTTRVRLQGEELHKPPPRQMRGTRTPCAARGRTGETRRDSKTGSGTDRRRVAERVERDRKR